MTHKLNVEQKVIIMNGYQCYLKRMDYVLPMEVKAANTLNYNLGIKMIRGAYMNEERDLAAQLGIDSPVFNSIEETHRCYNKNLQHIITNMSSNDQLFLATHNVETVDMAKELIEEHGLKETESVCFG